MTISDSATPPTVLSLDEAARDATAPLRVTLSVRVELPPDEVFDLVTNDLPSWFRGLGSVTWDNHGAAEPRVGSERACELGKGRLFETIRHWAPGRAYAYSVDMARSTVPFPVRNHLATFSVEPTVDGATRLTWRQYFDKRWHPMALFVTWIIEHRLMRPALEELLRQHGGHFLKV